MNSWRAGCSETGTSGSEGGPGKRTDRKIGTRAPARPNPSLSYELVDTPGHIAGGVAAYLDHFGLTFACFDFTVDHSGQWWFLEAGANAQWGWLEDETDLPIADAIACQLIGESA